MNLSLNGLVWLLLDPLLLKFRSRLEHLNRTYPSKGHYVGLEHVAAFDNTVKIFPDAKIANNSGNPSSLTIGSFSNVFGELVVIAPDAKLTLGHHSCLGWGSRVWALNNIEIGNYVLISHLVDIHDSDSHSLDSNDRRNDPVDVFERNIKMDISKVASSPVRIEDDVWIGFKSTIMKGVTIGKGSVVAATSVVRHNVPPYSIVAGNPAKIVGRPGILEPDAILS